MQELEWSRLIVFANLLVVICFLGRMMVNISLTFNLIIFGQTIHESSEFLGHVPPQRTFLCRVLDICSICIHPLWVLSLNPKSAVGGSICLQEKPSFWGSPTFQSVFSPLLHVSSLGNVVLLACLGC